MSHPEQSTNAETLTERDQIWKATAGHIFGNQLALATGYARMLLEAPHLPGDLEEIAEQVLKPLQDMGDDLRRIQNMKRFITTESGGRIYINLSASGQLRND